MTIKTCRCSNIYMHKHRSEKPWMNWRKVKIIRRRHMYNAFLDITSFMYHIIERICVFWDSVGRLIVMNATNYENHSCRPQGCIITSSREKLLSHLNRLSRLVTSPFSQFRLRSLRNENLQLPFLVKFRGIAKDQRVNKWSCKSNNLLEPYKWFPFWEVW